MTPNSTQLVGIISFAAAALLALLASRVVRRQRRSWTFVAAIHGILAVEVVAMSRHRAGAAIGDWLRGAELYPDRRLPQLVAILILTGLALLLGWWIVRGAGSRGTAVAAFATLVLVLLFLVESVSLHGVDQVLYQRLGPLLLIGWLWLACGVTTAIAAGHALLRLLPDLVARCPSRPRA